MFLQKRRKKNRCKKSVSNKKKGRKTQDQGHETENKIIKDWR